MGKKAKIKGGYTIWAKKTIESDIFLMKPAEWFKIWFYIISRAHYDGKKRGMIFLQTDWIMQNVKVTKAQVKKSLAFFRESGMIETQRSTRGMHIKVLNYDIFQDIRNYNGISETQTRPREDPEKTPDTKRKKERKNIISAKADDIFSFKDYVDGLLNDKRRHIHIIGLYWSYMGESEIPIRDKATASSQLMKVLRIAKDLTPYTDEEIKGAFDKLDKESNYGKKFPWSLNAVINHIKIIKKK